LEARGAHRLCAPSALLLFGAVLVALGRTSSASDVPARPEPFLRLAVVSQRRPDLYQVLAPKPEK